MPAESLRTFLDVLEVLRPAFTPAAYSLLVILVDGWLRTTGRHAVTEALVAAGVAGRRDHTAFHRFFARGTWDPDAVGRALFDAIVARLGPHLAAVALVVDDTLAPHKGPHVFGLGCHLDAVRSTRRRKVFAFGHVWVVLAVVVPVPFATRGWALPVAFRLYRTEAACAARGVPHRTKTALARELVDLAVTWLAAAAPDAAVLLAVDNGYANATVLAGLPAHVAVVGAMRPDAALEAVRTRRQRAALTPATLAADTTTAWRRTTAWLYGTTRDVVYKTVVAPWGRVTGAPPLRVVVVRCATGSLPLRVFFCTEPRIDVRALLEHYAATRWPIEVTFRDVKQLLGFAHTSARVEAAVRRVAPWVGALYTVLALWAVQSVVTPATVVRHECRWYRHKRTVAMSDVVRLVRKSLETGNLPALAVARAAAATARGERLPHARARPRRAT